MCDTKNKFSSRPLVEMDLNFSKLRKIVKVKMLSKIVLICEIEGVECLIQKHGEIFFRDTTDMTKMKSISAKIYSFR